MSKKLKTLALLGLAEVGICYLANKYMNEKNKNLEVIKEDMDFFESSYGKIKFETYGNPTGKPILLLHSFDFASSSFDFDDYEELGNTYKIYTLDFLGFGLSDKPNMTYSSYMYCSIVNEFINEVINKRTVIVTNENSYPIAVKSYLLNQNKISKLVLINPKFLNENKMGLCQKPIKYILENTFVGDLLFNISMLNNDFGKMVFEALSKGLNTNAHKDNYVSYISKSISKTGGEAKSVALYNYILNNFDGNVIKDLENIDIKTLIITSDKNINNETLENLEKSNKMVNVKAIESNTSKILIQQYNSISEEIEKFV